MWRIDLSKILFYIVAATLALGLTFGLGVFSAIEKNMAFDFVNGLVDFIEITYEELPNLLGTHPKDFLQPSRYEGDGVTVNHFADRTEDLVLLSGFFGDTNELRLIRRNGDLIARWPVRFSDVFPEPDHLPKELVPATDWNIDIHGAVALPDGSVVFNFEYGGLVKLDRCGDVVWALPRATHHSVERAEGGGFWVPGTRFLKGNNSPFPPFQMPRKGQGLFMREDTILKISDGGEVIAEISAPKIFYDNNLEAVLTATGYRFIAGMSWDREFLHLNKVDELDGEIADNFPSFAAGDLMLSIHDYNIIMILDPRTRNVKWWKVGPWLRQHDPEFKSDGTIVVFNNNAHRTAFGDDSLRSPLDYPRVSNIIEIDPGSGDHK